MIFAAGLSVFRQVCQVVGLGDCIGPDAAGCHSCSTVFWDDFQPGKNLLFKVYRGVGRSGYAGGAAGRCGLGFQQIMRTAAQSGRYEQRLAVLEVAEWSYLASARPHTEKASDLLVGYSGWISLHAGDGFEAVVAYLRRQLDQTWAGLSPKRRAAVETTFCQTVVLEVTFFDAPKRGFR